MTRGNKSFGLCGPDCLYRTLYEGSQASLSDMAGKQAGSLARVGRVRQGVVDSLKQTLPVEFGDAERSLGKRMSSVDDEVLLAYLGAFLMMPKTQTAARSASLPLVETSPVAAANLGPLREALTGAGIPLPSGDDPNLWADAVTKWAGKHTPPPVSATAPSAPGAAPTVRVSEARLVVDSYEPDYEHTPSPTPPPYGDEPFGGGMPDYSAADVPPLLNEFDNVPDEAPPASEEHGSPWAALFDPAPADPAPEPFPTAPATPTPQAVPDPVPATPEPAPADVPVPALVPPKAAVSVRQSGPLKAEALNPAPAAKKTTRRKPTKKVSRVTANAPGASDPRGELAQKAGASELTDEIREQLLATVYMARPVFAADLAHLIDNPELVEQWQDECYSHGADSPIRFLGAKARHRARGSLIIPRGDAARSSSDFDTSVWRQCIDSANLRGAKLYELAVLLHRVLDNLVTLDIGEDLVTLRVNQQRGLSGVILVLASDLSEGSPARAELRAALEGMTRGRLSMLALCSYTGGNRAVPDLAEAGRAELEAAGIQPSFPVIAQASWEFAADGGTSAISVLG
jgi:hypothetical protein